MDRMTVTRGSSSTLEEEEISKLFEDGDWYNMGTSPVP
jgi:hypothetical protein